MCYIFKEILTALKSRHVGIDTRPWLYTDEDNLYETHYVPFIES